MTDEGSRQSDLMKAADCAAMFDVNEQTWRKWVRERRVPGPAIKFNNVAQRWSRKALERWIQERADEAEAERLAAVAAGVTYEESQEDWDAAEQEHGGGERP